MQLDIPEYTIELWDISGSYVADISDIITSNLSIYMELNNVEEVSLSIDLVQFERKCADIGLNPNNVLDPYRTEIRIRRNNQYLVGVQVVQLVANFNNESANTLEIKCTGYLNYFKDRYSINGSYSNMTYAQIARQLIVDTQLQTNGDFGVDLGTDTASPLQLNTRVRNYDLQNIKDAIINLTKLENDNFDFKFSHDKIFSTYDHLGSMRDDVELVYPLNIFSMTVNRDASTLANKIYAVGSGIGQERIISTATDETSQAIYRVRERIDLFSSIKNQSELDANAQGLIPRYKDVYSVPKLKVSTNALDVNDVIVGDTIHIRVDGSTLVDNINGLYRIVAMGIEVTTSGAENISLEVVKVMI